MNIKESNLWVRVGIRDVRLLQCDYNKYYSINALLYVYLVTADCNQLRFLLCIHIARSSVLYGIN